jgi:hypothetical protein
MILEGKCRPVDIRYTGMKYAGGAPYVVILLQIIPYLLLFAVLLHGTILPVPSDCLRTGIDILNTRYIYLYD